MSTQRVSVVGSSVSSQAVVRRLAAAAGLDVVKSPLRSGQPPPKAALFSLPGWSEAELEEARRLVRELAPTPVVVLSEECHGGSCLELRSLGAAGCVALSGDEAQASRSLAAAVAGLETDAGPRCPRCPLDRHGGEGPLCTSLLPESLQPGWTGHDGHESLCFPFVAVSTTMRSLQQTVRRVAASDATVLLSGESGSGKEVLARLIHRLGRRARAPFVKVNCAALPDPLLESELFGYEKGAFTGAEARKPGRFELADGGIILLDEISETSLSLQAKLLQALEEKSFHRLGGVAPLKVDVQILAASNRSLEEEVRAGRLREDLYYRLRVIEIAVPPLRERREDIAPLVDYFLCRFSRQYGQPAPPLSPAALDRLERAPWAGNVRELENAIRRLVILGDEGLLLKELGGNGDTPRETGRFPKSQRFDARPSGPRRATTPTPPPGSLDLKEAARRAARRAERDAILTVLNQTRWNRTQAARLLGVSYKTLLAKMKELLPPGPTPA